MERKRKYLFIKDNFQFEINKLPLNPIFSFPRSLLFCLNMKIHSSISGWVLSLSFLILVSCGGNGGGITLKEETISGICLSNAHIDRMHPWHTYYNRSSKAKELTVIVDNERNYGCALTAQ